MSEHKDSGPSYFEKLQQRYEGNKKGSAYATFGLGTILRLRGLLKKEEHHHEAPTAPVAAEPKKEDAKAPEGEKKPDEGKKKGH